MPNYPQNSMQPEAGQQQGVMTWDQAERPRSIRDYYKMAISQQQAPMFTNVGESVGQGMPVGMEAEAIPGAPSQDPYERMGRADREAMDPYERVKQRLPSVLPELWNQVFPGRPTNAELTPKERQMWNGAVQKVSSELLKSYDAQFGRHRKMMMQQADSLRDFYIETGKMYDQIASNPGKELPTNPETGEPVSRDEYIKPRMDAYRAQLASLYEFNQETNTTEGVSTTGATPTMVNQAFTKDPSLRENVLNQALYFYNQAAGTNITKDELLRIAKMRRGQEFDLYQEAMQDAAQYYQDDILRVLKTKKPAISPKGAIDTGLDQ